MSAAAARQRRRDETSVRAARAAQISRVESATLAPRLAAILATGGSSGRENCDRSQPSFEAQCATWEERPCCMSQLR
jgi:hypothetical protein